MGKNVYKKAFCSFSGGKDSCLALYKAMKAGYEVDHLLTMSDENGIRSRSHGVSALLLKAQADLIGIELTTANVSWKSYEEAFLSSIKTFNEEGCDYGIFGDIDLDSHREWEENVCKRAEIEAILPLWGLDRNAAVSEFLDAGFKAKIVCVDGQQLDESYCGREFDEELLESMPETIDKCGENGEFHTFVYDGPLFKTALNVDVAEVYSRISTYAGVDHVNHFARLEIC